VLVNRAAASLRSPGVSALRRRPLALRPLARAHSAIALPRDAICLWLSLRRGVGGAPF